MSIITREIAGYLNKSSWIRRMFEAGLELKPEIMVRTRSVTLAWAIRISLRFPAVAQSLRDLADRVDQPLSLGYMPNAGYPTLRQALADRPVPRTTGYSGLGACDCHLWGCRWSQYPVSCRIGGR